MMLPSGQAHAQTNFHFGVLAQNLWPKWGNENLNSKENYPSKFVVNAKPCAEWAWVKSTQVISKWEFPQTPAKAAQPGHVLAAGAEQGELNRKGARGDIGSAGPGAGHTPQPAPQPWGLGLPWGTVPERPSPPCHSPRSWAGMDWMTTKRERGQPPPGPHKFSVGLGATMTKCCKASPGLQLALAGRNPHNPLHKEGKGIMSASEEDYLSLRLSGRPHWHVSGVI